MTSVKRDLSSRARFNQLQWINLEGSGPFKRNGKNMVVYALAAIAGVVAIFVVFGVKTSVRGISNLVTDPPSTQWFPSAVDDPNADITPVPDLSPEMTRVVHVHDPSGHDHHRHRHERARYTVVPHRGVMVEPGVSSWLRDVPDFDENFKGNIADVATAGRYALNPSPLEKKEVTDRSYLVYTEVLPGYTALACNW